MPGDGSGTDEIDPDTVVLVEAAPSDWPAIAELHAASWAFAYRGMQSDAYLDGPVFADRREAWRVRYAGPVGPDLVTILALDGGDRTRPLGFACILAGHDPVWGSLIDNLHVRPGLTRLRLGRRLLREAASRVPARHAQTAIHLTVLEDNARARAAYESWGGERVQRLVEPAGPDGAPARILRYAWANPPALVRRLDAGT